jgi:hypothetical protein
MNPDGILSDVTRLACQPMLAGLACVGVREIRKDGISRTAAA